MKLKILDCTLRDGGYHCDWHFDESTVQKYLSAVSTAKVDIVEIPVCEYVNIMNISGNTLIR